MKGLVLDQPGTPDTLHVAKIRTPESGVGEVRVRVHAAALNLVDYKRAQSVYPTWQYPFGLGLDVAGTIDTGGPGVKDWRVGDRVFYHGDLSRPGSYAEYATVVADVLVCIPEGVSFVKPAALPAAGFATYQAVFRWLHLQAGQTLPVQGGAGGVGGSWSTNGGVGRGPCHHNGLVPQL